MYATVEGLPDWGINLLVAREVRRQAQAYFKAHRSAPGRELFEQLACEFDTGGPSQGVLDALRPRFEALLESMESPATRGPLHQAARTCGDPAARRWRVLVWHDDRFACILPKDERKADGRLYERTLARDVAEVHRAADAPAARLALGGLWPLGEPHWLKVKWRTYRQQIADMRHIWMEDAPAERIRAAPLARPSDRLPKPLRHALSPVQWDLTYRGAMEVSLPSTTPSKRSGRIFTPKRHVRRFTFPAAHRFRKPAPPSVLAQYTALVGKVPAIMTSLAFYREHDGALLFRRRGAKAAEAHVWLYGLLDQPRALKRLLYYIGHWEFPERDTGDKVLAHWGCDRKSVIVVATVGVSMFFMPLKGPHAGKVIRVYLMVQRHDIWAGSLADAIARIRDKVVVLAARDSCEVQLGDEARGGTTELTLAKAVQRE